MVLTLAVPVATGCSDEQKPPGDSKQPPATKADYIANADDICRAADKAAKKLEAKLDALSADVEIKVLASTFENALPKSRETLARLRALPAPSEDKPTLDAFYASVMKDLGVAEQFVVAVKANDEAKANKLSEGYASSSAEQAALAKQYGFRICGR